MTHDYRFEIKVPVPINRLSEVLCWLKNHAYAFGTHHPARFINSLYLDSAKLDCYEQNLSGISVRKKARIRWYGDISDTENAKLEFKLRRGGKGTKTIFSCPLDLSESVWPKVLTKAKRELEPTATEQLGELVEPVLICRYKREYYVSFDRSVRVTLDSKMEVFEQRYHAKINTQTSRSLGEYYLVEVKCDARDEDKLAELMRTCPLRPSRHSKYVNGIRNLMWQ